jgi:DHA1 family tetracycline resistance protein-like MFS transporter
MVDMIGFGIVIPILQLSAEERFGASNVQATALLAAFAAAQLVAAPLMGRLSDAFGRRPVLILSQIGTLAGFIILGTAGSLFALFLGRIIDGASGGNITTAEAYVNDVTSEEERAKGFGLIKAAYGAGFILGPVLGGLVVKFTSGVPELAAYSQSAPFFLAAVFSLVSIVATVLWLPESLPARDRLPLGQRQVKSGARLADVLGLGPVRLILVYALLSFLAFTIFTASFALVVARNVFPESSLEDTQLAMALMFAWAGVLLVIIQGGLVGPMVARFGERRLVVFSSLLRIPAFIGMALAHSPYLMAFWIIPMALGNGLGQTTQQSLLSRFAPPTMRGQLLGILAATNSLALIAGPLLAGLLLNISPAAPNLMAAGLTAVAFIISLPILSLSTPAPDGPVSLAPAAVPAGD